MTNRTMHRLIGILMALPLLVWIVTGVLFNVKYRYAEAYETLEIQTPASWESARKSPAELVQEQRLDGTEKMALFASPFVSPAGTPAYAGMHEGKPVAISAATGEDIPAANQDDAKKWADAAIARSANASRYGTVQRMSEGTRVSMRTGFMDPAFVMVYSGGKRVTVDRITGEMSQTGTLNDWIDWTYHLHYLQWTPWRMVNIALVLIATPLTLVLAFSGLVMAFGKRGGYSGRRPNSFY